MIRIPLIFCFVLLCSTFYAQDNYHRNLRSQLENEYGLPGGTWVMNDTESENVLNTYSYGNLDTQVDEYPGEPFEFVYNISNNQVGDYFYDNGWGQYSEYAVSEGDVCLLVFNMRKITQAGKVTLAILNEDNSVFEENLTINLEPEWQQYLVPFRASVNFPIEDLTIAFNAAWDVQEIEISGLNVMNYGSNHTLDQLPFIIHNDRYPGYEANAEWRSRAAERIETHRTSDLIVEVTDINDQAIEDAEVSIRMIESEFKWGTHILLDRIAGNWNQNDTYEDKILNLDGEGHRFNWIVPGNSFKWPGWEENWITNPDEKVTAAQWLKQNDFKLRFHTLLWPAWIHSPEDIGENSDNPEYILNRLENWIDEITSYPGLENVFDEYDVINESSSERDFENALAGYQNYTTGREIYPDVMEQLQQIAPNTPQVVNDYITISQQQTQGFQYRFLQNTLDEIIDSGAPLGGIGFQAHISLFPTSLFEVEEILMDYSDKYDVPLKITEYDISDARIDDETAGNYLEDFLTMIYSIPQVDMFMFWGLWDETHWTENGTFFYSDWTEKPAATKAFNKIFGEWWTEDSDRTNNLGNASFGAHKGQYEITVRYLDEVLTDTINLDEDTSIKYSLDLLVDQKELKQADAIEIYPNPAIDFVNVRSTKALKTVIIRNSKGQDLLTENINGAKQLRISTKNYSTGFYRVQILNSEGESYRHELQIME